MIIAGRGIGYIEPPLDKIHASLRDGRSLLIQSEELAAGPGITGADEKGHP